MDYLSTINTEMSVESENNNKDKVKTNYRDLEDINLEITSNNTLLPGPCSAKNSDPEKRASMVEFDIMQSSLLAKPATATID